MFTGREGVSEVQEPEETLDESSDVQDSTTDGASSDDTEGRKESARETVERVFREASENEGDGDPSAPEQETKEPGGSEVAPQPQQDPQRKRDNREWDPELQPPSRATVQEKEDWHRLPKGQKRFINRMVQEHERSYTQGMQQLAAREREYADIDAVVRPFLADWAKSGYSRSQAIAELIGVHEKLRLDKPKQTRMDELKWLCENCDVDLDELYAHVKGARASGGGAGADVDISNHPLVKELRNEISTLRNDVAPIRSSYQQHAAQQEQHYVASVTDELRSVRDERDRNGRYRYPDLHDDNFLERVKPLVSGLVGTVPGISYGEALRRAYTAAGGRIVGTSAPSQTGFPAPQQSNSNSRALSASVSLRGRSAPTTGVSDEPAPPPEVLKSPQATAEWVFRNAGRGR